MKPNSSQKGVGYFPQQPKKSSVPVIKRKKVLWYGALVLSTTVFLVSTFFLIRYFGDIAASKRASRELEAVYASMNEPSWTPDARQTLQATPLPTHTPVPQPSASAPRTTPTAEELWPTRYPNNPSLRVSAVFYELQRKNEDIVGWLKIDGVLEEAVCQRDNSYYLTHNALKQKSVTGALFLDEACDLKTVPTQMVIYGHNMKEGAMFGSLKKYKLKDANFYHQHPFIEWNTQYENGRYVIFAVCEVDLRRDNPDYLPFWMYSRFSDAETFLSYVEKARALSRYRCGVTVEPSDRLLTLSTCIGDDANRRLLVMARRIRDDESELELNMAVYSTSDR